MSTYNFRHYSDFFSTNGKCNKIDVEIEVKCYDLEGDMDWNIDSIYDETAQCFRKLEDFPEDEMLLIEREAEKKAEDNAYDAYIDYSTGKADALYDSWKDGDQ